MVELVTVIVVMGIVGAVGAARFFDKRTTDISQYGNQVKTIFRYGQKVAIAQHRNVYVTIGANSTSLCYALACTAAKIVPAPSGGNSASSMTKTQCVLGSPAAYVSSWMCEGMPTDVTTAVSAGLINGIFFFDSQGRPYNSTDSTPNSTFNSALTVTVNGGSASTIVTVAPETGYVY